MSYNYKKLFIPAREMRKNQTNTENKMWSLLRNRQLNGLKFLRQKILGEFIMDFYCHEKKIVIEIDGKIHEKQKERDRERGYFLESKFELKIIRYINEFVLNNNEAEIEKRLLEDIRKI